MRRIVLLAVVAGAACLALSAPPARADSHAPGGLRLTVQTVPAVEGVELRVFTPCTLYLPPGQSLADFCFSGAIPAPESWAEATDETGAAAIDLPGPGLYHLQTVSAQLKTQDGEAAFSRWEDDTYTPDRLITLEGDTELRLGMDLSQWITLQFTGPDGQRVPPERVNVVGLRNSVGSVFELTGPGPHLLPAIRSLRRDFGLEPAPIVYAVQQVGIEGSNAVNRGQQRFSTDTHGGTWNIGLLLFTAEFQGRDALFGFPMGTGVQLEYPDGQVRELPYGPDGRAEASDLARGTYRVRVIGRGGVALTSLVVVSRDQFARPVVLSYLDLGVLFLGGASLALVVLIIGRPHLAPAAAERLRRLGLPVRRAGS